MGFGGACYLDTFLERMGPVEIGTKRRKILVYRFAYHQPLGVARNALYFCDYTLDGFKEKESGDQVIIDV